MNDPKLTSSILDLSRNVDKLVGELRKNTSAVELLTQSNEEKSPNEGLSEISEGIGKNLGLDKVADEISGVSEKLEELDFKSLTEKIGKLDFDKISGSLKGLIKTKSSEAEKSQTFPKFGEELKNIFSGSLKDLKSNILGGFESGGKVNRSGNYIVGEKGPEVVKLNKGDKVVSNKELLNAELLSMAIKDMEEQKKSQSSSRSKEVASQLLSEKKASAPQKGGPSPEELEEQRKKLISENPELANDPQSLADELKYFISEYNRATFTREDLSKLTSPIAPKSVEIQSDSIAGKEQKSTADAISLKKMGIPDESEPSEKKTGKFREFTQKLGKKVSDFFGKKGPEPETPTEGETINSPIGLGPATKKSLKEPFGELLKPTLQKSISKISPSSRISKEIGELGKKTAPSIDTNAMIGQLTSSIGNLVEGKAKEKKSSQESGGLEIESSKSVESTLPSSQAGSGIEKKDLDEMKSALIRIASLLEGPLTVAPLDSPFRPDSRRV